MTAAALVRLAAIILVGGTLPSPVLAYGYPPSHISGSAAVDLDGDGLPEEVMAVRGLTGDAPRWHAAGVPSDTTRLGSGALFVRSGATGEWAAFEPAEYAPILLRIADIDGDGETEVALGVLDRDRPSARRPAGAIRRQLHVFRYRQGRIVPVWFCGRSFLDFRFAELGGRIRLLELSRAHSVYQLRIFSWRGFGWWRDAGIDLGRERVTLGESAGRVYLDREGGPRMEVGWDDEHERFRFGTR